MKIKILFAKSNSIGGLIVRLATMSNRNHVAIQVDQFIYEASSRYGVTKITEETFYQEWDVKEVIELEVPNVSKLKQFLEAQLGKPYDWRAIIAMPLQIDWHRKDAWFCSELVAKALHHSGLIFQVKHNRITPRDLLVALSIRGALYDKN